jgi:radical SAM protein with 4Fe4S-binding SPASM domain
MSDKYRAFIVDRERKPLHTLLPLSRPLAVVIVVSSIWNFRCGFCYHYFKKDGDIHNDRFMSLDLFKKITHDLSEFDDRINIVTIGGQDGEPLLNRDFPRYIRILKESGVARKIKTNTNAVKLTPVFAKEIIDAGLDIMSISINGINNRQYRKIVNRNIEFDSILDNIKYFHSIKGYCHIHIKGMADHYTPEEKEIFMELFSPYADSIHFDNICNQWNEIAVETKNDVHRFNLPQTGGICNIPFYRFLIHTNGMVSPCFHDWNQKLIVGDAWKMTVKEIWDGKVFNDLRIAHLTGNLSSFTECSHCDFNKFATSEDLSPFRNQLLQAYLSENQ